MLYLQIFFLFLILLLKDTLSYKDARSTGSSPNQISSIEKGISKLAEEGLLQNIKSEPITIVEECTIDKCKEKNGQIEQIQMEVSFLNTLNNSEKNELSKLSAKTEDTKDKVPDQLEQNTNNQNNNQNNQNNQNNANNENNGNNGNNNQNNENIVKRESKEVSGEEKKEIKDKDNNKAENNKTVERKGKEEEEEEEEEKKEDEKEENDENEDQEEKEDEKEDEKEENDENEDQEEKEEDDKEDKMDDDEKEDIGEIEAPKKDKTNIEKEKNEKFRREKKNESLINQKKENHDEPRETQKENKKEMETVNSTNKQKENETNKDSNIIQEDNKIKKEEKTDLKKEETRHTESKQSIEKKKKGIEEFLKENEKEPKMYELKDYKDNETQTELDSDTESYVEFDVGSDTYLDTESEIGSENGDDNNSEHEFFHKFKKEKGINNELETEKHKTKWDFPIIKNNNQMSNETKDLEKEDALLKKEMEDLYKKDTSEKKEKKSESPEKKTEESSFKNEKSKSNMFMMDANMKNNLTNADNILGELRKKIEFHRELKDRELLLKFLSMGRMKQYNIYKSLLKKTVELLTLRLTKINEDIKTLKNQSDYILKKYIQETGGGITNLKDLPQFDKSEKKKMMTGSGNIFCPINCDAHSCHNNPKEATQCYKLQQYGDQVHKICEPFIDKEKATCRKDYMHCAMAAPERNKTYTVFVSGHNANISQYIKVNGYNMHECLQLLVVNRNSVCTPETIDRVFAESKRKVSSPVVTKILPNGGAIFKNIQVSELGEYGLCLAQFYETENDTHLIIQNSNHASKQKRSRKKDLKILGIDNIGTLSVIPYPEKDAQKNHK